MIPVCFCGHDEDYHSLTSCINPSIQACMNSNRGCQSFRIEKFIFKSDANNANL